jgi:hypothetical protein
MNDTMTLTKLQKNSAERRKRDPTRTNSLKMVFIIVRMTDNRLDIFTKKSPKMRSDRNQGEATLRRKRPVKLEISANNYTKSILIPNETRPTIKSALKDSKNLFAHFDDSV